MKVRSSVVCSVRKMVEFTILEGSKAKNKITALDFRKADLQPLQRPPWKNPMEYDPGEKRCQGELADIQGSPPPSSGKVCPDKQKTKQSGRRPAWMSTELLTELEHKTKCGMKGWKQGQVTQVE